ncbi:hypothetical protein AVEN_267378-1 [Araneus ventricosus]|uniref:Uncharacterized protein n=1 Tax=Araneus ventricosus TaxID=182803 RepID=A0A4Y2GRN4_ARAVE|nr:hypothetical protein AVEN_267378-1 [Araneus ventricosus]
MNLIILNHGQLTRTPPALAPSLQTSMPHQQEGVWPLRMTELEAGPIHGGSPAESGFEPGTLRVQSRHLITRPPLPLICSRNQRHMSLLGFRLCKLRLNVLIKKALVIIKKNVCVSVGWSSTGQTAGLISTRLDTNIL